MTRPQRASRTRSTIGANVTCVPPYFASIADISVQSSARRTSNEQPKAKGIGNIVR